MRSVPASIPWPEYARTGRPQRLHKHIFKYDDEAVSMIRESAQLARHMLDFSLSLARPGISTEEIDILSHEEMVKHMAYPSPINYCGFPKAICTSVNDAVCHGIPDSRVLEEGDILSIDVSLYKNGFHGDNCGTVIVGGSSPSTDDPEAEHLVDTARRSLEAAIETCGPGSCLSAIGDAIQNVADTEGLGIVNDFMGHGVGPYLHMMPYVRHFRNNEKLNLLPGMVFTIEPILTEGSGKIKVWDDGWTAVSVDGGRGAQFEHMVLVTENGAEVLTVP
jgi:methionyl aminopeptidase